MAVACFAAAALAWAHPAAATAVAVLAGVLMLVDRDRQ